MPEKLLEIWIDETCLKCGKPFLMVATGVDQYGNKKCHTKCRFCGMNFYDKIGMNELTHLEGVILERVVEYLQNVSPLKLEKVDK